MIIGVSGKQQSGKDTIGRIVQYFTSSYYPTMPLWQYMEEKKYGTVDSIYKIVKFANRLKQILCLLTGCTMKQLENDAFKNSTLPDEWVEEFLATPESVEWGQRTMTYRTALQCIGTDLFRKQFHEDTWVNATMRDYVSEKDLNTEYAKAYPDNMLPLSNWIITDVRFTNEARAIKDRNGILIRVNRPTTCANYEDENINKHSSETALDNYKFDYVITNSGTIEDLATEVREILKKENIL